MTRRLTVNLGIRYDYQQPPYERNGGTSEFQSLSDRPGLGSARPPRILAAILRQDVSALRLQQLRSARWLCLRCHLGNGKTVFRGGYAIFYPSIFNLNYFGNTAGFAATTTSYNPPGGNSNLPAFILSQGLPPSPRRFSRLAPRLDRMHSSGRAPVMIRRLKKRRCLSSGIFPCKNSCAGARWWISAIPEITARICCPETTTFPN